jgi:hypothetical protein
MDTLTVGTEEAPKTFDITLPDGKTVIHNVPVGTPREEVIARATAMGWKPGPTTFQKGVGIAEAGATGALKGAISSTIGLPGDLADLGQLGANKLGFDVPEPTGEGFFPRSHDIYAKLPELHKPADLTEQVAEGAGAGVASVVNPFAPFGKGKLLTKGLALAGGVGGGGGELAANWLPNHPDAARAAAFLAALSPAAYTGFRKPNVVRSVQDYVNELGPEGLQAADTARKEASTTLNVPTLLSQGTPGKTALSSIVDELKKTPMGTDIRRVLDVQPKAGQQKIDDLVAALSNKPVGQQTANEIAAAGKVATRVADPLDALFGGGEKAGFNVTPKTDATAVSFPENMTKSGIGNYSTMGQVLSDSTKYGPADVARVADDLNKVDPTAFPSLVKHKFSAASGEAQKAVEGRVPPTAPAQFAEDVAGAANTPKRANFEATMKGVARAHGLPEEEAAKGAVKFVEALQLIGRDQGGSGLSGMQRESGTNIWSKILKSLSFTPAQSTATTIQQGVQRNTYRKLAEAMTSEDGVKTLIKIARWSHPEQAAITTARGLIATSADVAAQSGDTPVVQP